MLELDDRDLRRAAERTFPPSLAGSRCDARRSLIRVRLGPLVAQLALGLQPIFQLTTGFAPASLVDFIGPPCDLLVGEGTVFRARRCPRGTPAWPALPFFFIRYWHDDFSQHCIG